MGARIVVCMRWGTLYPPAYVNVLHSAVRRNLSGDFRFVCLTDDPTGLAPGIESHPIPEFGLPKDRWGKGIWPKIGLFARDLYGLSGRCLFMDLDSQVMGPLDPLFEVPGRLVALAGGPGWRPGRPNPHPRLMSSIIAFDIGGLTEVYDRLVTDMDAAFRVASNDQEFLEVYVPDWRPWPSDWMVSFKRHLRRPALVGLLLSPRRPGPRAKLVVFHGEPRPIDLARADAGFWGAFPHLGYGPVPWVRQYWIENGFDAL